MYKNNLDEFNRKAAEWTTTYAKEVTPDDKVTRLMEMGFPEEACRKALADNKFDENLALNSLLGGAWIQ